MLIPVTISASDHSNVINSISASTIWPQKFSNPSSTHSPSTWKSTLPDNGLIPPTSSATWPPSAALGFWPKPSSGFWSPYLEHFRMVSSQILRIPPPN
jgi:hypothetical protein